MDKDKMLDYFNDREATLFRDELGSNARYHELLRKKLAAEDAHRKMVGEAAWKQYLQLDEICNELESVRYQVMANFAKDEFSAANAYVLSMLGEDYGSGLATYFVNAFEDLGGTVTSEQFPEGTSDFSAYIQNAINAGADVIFAPCATTYAAQIITQAAAAGFDKPITAGDTWESSVILDAQKGTSVQVYCSTFFDENDDSGAAKEFVTGFKEWLNADSQKLTNNGGNDIVAAVSALGYDAYMTALEAIKAAGSTDGTAIKDALFGVDYDGVTGSITFDQTTGDANKDMAYIKKADNGAFAFVKTQSVEG